MRRALDLQRGGSELQQLCWDELRDAEFWRSSATSTVDIALGAWGGVDLVSTRGEGELRDLALDVFPEGRLRAIDRC